MTLIRLEFVLLLHEKLLAVDGGEPGIRDRGLLESALNRAENLVAYEHPNLPSIAAVYCHGLCQNYPFVDGNKRVAFVVAATFLEMNVYELTATQEDALLFMLGVASSELDQALIDAWFQANSEPKG